MLLSFATKRSVSKKILLLAAGLAWSLSSIIVISDGLKNLVEYSHHLQFHLMISFLSGTFFYIIFLKRISDTHANKIYSIGRHNRIKKGINSLRAYILIICCVVFLYNIKNKMYFHPVDTSIMFIIFGIGLFLSSIRFFYLFVFFLRTYKKYYTSKEYITL